MRNHGAKFVFLVGLLSGSPAAAEDYNFTDRNQRNTVMLMLDAPFESINGVANGVEGRVVVDGGKASGSFKVKVASIKTGNESRDGHLQNEKWLNAGKWPHIEFTFKNLVLPADFKSGKAVTLKANGELSIHGVKKQKTVDVTLQYFKESAQTRSRLPGNLIRIRSRFDVKLASHNVAQSDSGVKSLIGLKVGEVASVSIDFFGTDAK